MAFVEVSKQGHVGIVTMNRPETLNALSSAVFADLLKAFDVVENDEEIYVVVVTGAGRSFVAGADISEMATMNVVEGKNFGDLGNQAMLRLERMEKPTIAAINGFALGGGCELSMACDIRIASRSARLGESYMNLGIVPGDGGTYFLPRIVGADKALDMFWTARTLTGEEAEKAGLVTFCVPDEELDSFTQSYMERLASGPQQAMRMTKRAVRQGAGIPLRTALDMISSSMGIVTELPDFHDRVEKVRQKITSK